MAASPVAAGEFEDLLARPPSPGALALLVPHAADPRTHPRFAAAIKDPRPEVRTAAARAVHVASLRGGALAALEDALATETDAEAAREQIRALASLSGGAADAAMRAAAKRFEGRLDGDFLEAVARTRGPEAIPILFADEWSKTVPAQLRASLLVVAARGDVESQKAALRSVLERGDAASWEAFLALRPPSQPAVGLLIPGLESARAEIAAPTAWHLADRVLRQAATPPELMTERWRPPADSDPDAAFAFELLRRSLGTKAVAHPEWIRFLDEAKVSLADRLWPESPMAALLQPDEREALRRRRDRRSVGGGLQVSIPKDGGPRQVLKGAAPAAGGLTLRIPSDLPAGTTDDALAVAGCKAPKREAFGAAQVIYNVEGRPLRVSPIAMAGPKSCERAAMGLFLMTLAPARHFPMPARPQILIAMADRECLHEMEEPDVPLTPWVPDVSAEASGTTEAPKLKRKVQPNYPASVRSRRVEGVVVLEAIISRDGCVREIQTLQGVDPMLDYEAARAVSQWWYQPATIDGKPVRVYLTVAVTFALAR